MYWMIRRFFCVAGSTSCNIWWYFIFYCPSFFFLFCDENWRKIKGNQHRKQPLPAGFFCFFVLCGRLGNLPGVGCWIRSPLHHTRWCNKFNLFLGHLLENPWLWFNLRVDDSYMPTGDVVRDTSLSFEARGERGHKGDPHDLTGVLVENRGSGLLLPLAVCVGICRIETRGEHRPCESPSTPSSMVLTRDETTRDLLLRREPTSSSAHSLILVDFEIIESISLMVALVPWSTVVSSVSQVGEFSEGEAEGTS